MFLAADAGCGRHAGCCAHDARDGRIEFQRLDVHVGDEREVEPIGLRHGLAMPLVISWAAIQTVVERLAGILLLPIMTRFLTPADYGIVDLLEGIAGQLGCPAGVDNSSC